MMPGDFFRPYAESFLEAARGMLSGFPKQSPPTNMAHITNNVTVNLDTPPFYLKTLQQFGDGAPNSVPLSRARRKVRRSTEAVHEEDSDQESSGERDAQVQSRSAYRPLPHWAWTVQAPLSRVRTLLPLTSEPGRTFVRSSIPTQCKSGSGLCQTCLADGYIGSRRFLFIRRK